MINNYFGITRIQTNVIYSDTCDCTSALRRVHDQQMSGYVMFIAGCRGKLFSLLMLQQATRRGDSIEALFNDLFRRASRRIGELSFPITRTGVGDKKQASKLQII